MPRVYITKTVGPNLVQGTIRNLSARTLQSVSERHGSDWYEANQSRPRRRYMLEQQAPTTKRGRG